MYLERFGLPTRDEEKEYLFNCARGDGAIIPFGVFEGRSLRHVDLSDVTVFCGGEDSEKDLMLELIAAKLGICNVNEGLQSRMVRGYLEMCYTRFAEFVERRSDVEKIFISRERAFEELQKNKYCFDGGRTLLHFYESNIKGKTICILEQPEIGMSLDETLALACLIEDFVSYSGTQFIISTNSPALLGIKDALIYDFDDRAVVGHTWYNSKSAAKHISFYKELINKHKTE